MNKISRRNLDRIIELSVKTMAEQREFMLISPQTLIEIGEYVKTLEDKLNFIRKQASIDDND